MGFVKDPGEAVHGKGNLKKKTAKKRSGEEEGKANKENRSREDIAADCAFQAKKTKTVVKKKQKRGEIHSSVFAMDD